MFPVQTKHINVNLALIVILGLSLYAAQNRFENQLGLLQEQIAALGEKVQILSGENSRVTLSLKELENRKGVREKSQDELLTETVAKITPSVVSIVISKDVPRLEVEYVNPFGDDPFFKDFNYRVPVYRQKGVERQKVGAGSGFLITDSGYILTNRHVVADLAAEYTALLSDGRQINGRVVFRDTTQDIALLKIEGGPFKFASLGDSGSLKLGQTVIAVGNALGEYNNSVSVGIISGLNRTLEARDGGRLVKLSGVIQTDAAINPGNSGGPLLTMEGKVIGVNVATVIGSSNISFSIPIVVAKTLISAYLK